MAIKCVINHGKTGKSYAKTVDLSSFTGRKLGETLPGSIVGMAGYELKITGGSDTAGFPLKQELDSGGRKKMLLQQGAVGAHVKRKGGVVRKTVRGNSVNEFTAQLNLHITKEGTKKVEELLGKKEEKKVEAKPEEKKEAPKEEKKVEEKKEAPKEEKKAE